MSFVFVAYDPDTGAIFTRVEVQNLFEALETLMTGQDYAIDDGSWPDDYSDTTHYISVHRNVQVIDGFENTTITTSMKERPEHGINLLNDTLVESTEETPVETHVASGLPEGATVITGLPYRVSDGNLYMQTHFQLVASPLTIEAFPNKPFVATLWSVPSTTYTTFAYGASNAVGAAQAIKSIVGTASGTSITTRGVGASNEGVGSATASGSATGVGERVMGGVGASEGLSITLGEIESTAETAGVSDGQGDTDGVVSTVVDIAGASSSTGGGYGMSESDATTVGTSNGIGDGAGVGATV